MSDSTPIYVENDGTNPIGEGTPTYGGEDTPTPTSADEGTPTPAAQDEAPTPAPEGQDEGTTKEAPEGVATRDGQIVDPYPVTPEDMARVKARRHQATGVATTDADVTQA